jgi:hypothetical protein
VWLGDVAGERSDHFVVPTDPRRDFGIFSKDEHGIAPSPNVFRIKTTEKSPPGRHTTLLCQFSITENGEPIAHTVGNGELRIDKPLPPKLPEE